MHAYPARPVPRSLFPSLSRRLPRCPPMSLSLSLSLRQLFRPASHSDQLAGGVALEATAGQSHANRETTATTPTAPCVKTGGRFNQ